MIRFRAINKTYNLNCEGTRKTIPCPFYYGGKFTKSQKGFTLIELLVVVAILGVLAAIAVPNVAHFIGQGNTTAIQTNAAAIQTAADAYAAREGEYPEDLTTLVPDYLRSWPEIGTYTIKDGTVKGK
jgi:prepilin-type N-terminal cleavage/methylation domain-containing protein